MFPRLLPIFTGLYSTQDYGKIKSDPDITNGERRTKETGATVIYRRLADALIKMQSII